jgi:hypothetical protein
LPIENDLLHTTFQHLYKYPSGSITNELLEIELHTTGLYSG